MIPDRCNRLYVLVRADLPPGLQTAHTTQAAMLYAHQHREMTGVWFYRGGNLIVLAVANEAELRALVDRAATNNVLTSTYFDCDTDVAVAAAFSGDVRTMVSHLPLALRDEPLRHAHPKAGHVRGWLRRIGARLLYA